MITDQITLGSLVTGVPAIVGIVGLFIQQRNARVKDEERAETRDRERDAAQARRHSELLTETREHNASMDRRIGTIEATLAEHRVKLENFVPKTAIDERFEHMRGNMKQAEVATAHLIEKHDDQISGLKVEVGKLATLVEGFSQGLTAVRSDLKELSKEMSAQFEKMREAISHVGAGR